MWRLGFRSFLNWEEREEVEVCQDAVKLMLCCSYCCCSVAKLSDSATPWTATRQASLPLAISQSLPKFMSVELVMPSNRLILCLPLLLPSVFPSIKVFSNESAVPAHPPQSLP